MVSFSSDFDRLLAGRSRVRPASGILRLRVGRWHDVTAVCGCHAYDGGASAVVGVCLAPLGTDGSGATVLLHATIAATGGRAVLSQVRGQGRHPLAGQGSADFSQVRGQGRCPLTCQGSRAPSCPRSGVRAAFQRSMRECQPAPY